MTVNLLVTIKEKYEKLKQAIQVRKKIVVAYSGGVDSALLAKIAYDELEKNAWAVFIDSETVPEVELESAKTLAKKIGINFEVIQIKQLSDDKFTTNSIDRCYYCRKSMAKALFEFSHKKGISTIAAGAQATDLEDYRPGIKAFHEAKIWHPFIEFKFNKTEVRELAKFLALPVHNKPSMACLSSRIPYGQRITSETLNMIAAAEEYLRKLGFTQYRARTHDQLIRLEINLNEIDKLLTNRTKIVKKLKEIGYKYVSLDLEGFRTGSMNEVLLDKSE